jgi:hypothetical protein
MDQYDFTIPEQIIKDLEAERAYASKYWDPDFDACNTVNDWATYVMIYLSRATKMRGREEPPEQQRARQRSAMVKAASLCISALEAFDEANGFPDRHYD